MFVGLILLVILAVIDELVPFNIMPDLDLDDIGDPNAQRSSNGSNVEY